MGKREEYNSAQFDIKTKSPLCPLGIGGRLRNRRFTNQSLGFKNLVNFSTHSKIVQSERLRGRFVKSRHLCYVFVEHIHRREQMYFGFIAYPQAWANWLLIRMSRFTRALKPGLAKHSNPRLFYVLTSTILRVAIELGATTFSVRTKATQ